MKKKRLNQGISVVVPVFNSAAILPQLVKRIWHVLETTQKRIELILVNDGSADESWRMIKKLSVKYPFIKGVCLMRNYGQHNALLAGIRLAQYDKVVTLDDDLQNPPEEIPNLLKALSPKVDVVYGVALEKSFPARRKLCSAALRILLGVIVGHQTATAVSSFRSFRTKIRDAFDRYDDPFVSIDVLLAWGASCTKSVKVNHNPRISGTSTYNTLKLLGHALDMVTGFSAIPLRLASITGFTFVLFGFAVFLYVIGCYFFKSGSVPGFPFLASIVTLFSGAQLFALGLIGEYLAKIHFRSMNRPPYVVSATT